MARKPRTDAEKAYAEAERLIEEARSEGATELNLSGLRTDALKALDRIPESIADVQGLAAVDLWGTKVTDLTPLSRLPALASLYLWDTPVADLTPLSRLPALASLYLWDTPVTDLTPLARLYALATLNLGGTPVTDLSPLAHLPALATLSLGNTKVTDLTPLAHLPALATLRLAGTKVTDLTPLAHLPGLAALDLEGTRVTDLSPLAHLPAMTALDLGGTMVAELAHLANLTRIKQLDIANTLVTRDGLLALRRLRRLVTDPGGPKAHESKYHGLRLTGCAATREDPRIAEIAEIEDPSARARALFEHLGIWEEEEEAGEGPVVPPSAPAPLETEIVEDRLVRADRGPPEVPTDAVASRARTGWDVIRDFRDGFVQSVNVANYRPLAAALAALDRALGPSYDRMNEIGVGLAGQRLDALSRDREFVASLPDGAGSELGSLASAIATFSNRFPVWLEYLKDAEAGKPLAPLVQDELAAFDALARSLEGSADVDRDVSAEFRDEVELARQNPESEPAARALLASTRELLRTLAENAVMDAKLYYHGAKDSIAVVGRSTAYQAVEFAKVIPGELRKAVWWGGCGVVVDVLFFKAAGTLALAQNFPNVLGWIVPVLRFLGVA